MIVGTVLRVSMRKTKVLIARLWLYVLQKFDKYPSGMCLVGTTKIISFVIVVLHGDTRYIALSDTLKPDPIFIWKQRTGLARALQDKLVRDVTVGSAILLLLQKQLILSWRLWHFLKHKKPHFLEHTQWAPAHPHLRVTPQHLQNKRVYYSCIS